MVEWFQRPSMLLYRHLLLAVPNYYKIAVGPLMLQGKTAIRDNLLWCFVSGSRGLTTLTNSLNLHILINLAAPQFHMFNLININYRKVPNRMNIISQLLQIDGRPFAASQRWYCTYNHLYTNGKYFPYSNYYTPSRDDVYVTLLNISGRTHNYI